MKVLWRSDVISNPIGQEARVIDLDGEKIIEMAVTDTGSFFNRLISCVRYLFYKKPFVTSFVLADGDFVSMCEEVVLKTGGVRCGRKDC